jgi:hypothetical protein
MREAKGIQRKELLALLQTKGLNISSTSLSRLEWQDRAVTDFEVIAVCEALGADLDYLMGWKQQEGDLGE